MTPSVPGLPRLLHHKELVQRGGRLFATLPRMDSSDNIPKTSLKSRGPMVGVVVVVLLLIAAGVAAWYFYGRPQVVTPVAVTETPLVPDAGLPAEPSVDLAKGDALLGGSVASLSDSAELASWMTGPDLVRRVVAAVASVSEGGSPRPMLGFLAPDGAFSVVQKGKKTFIADASYARYDKTTAVIEGVNAEAVGKAYREMSEFLQGAYREIGPRGARFDEAFTRAVASLAAVPVNDTPREVVPGDKGIGFVFVDPTLESLTPAQKHLLRMGPKNARVVVKQLQAFQAAAGL